MGLDDHAGTGPRRNWLFVGFRDRGFGRGEADGGRFRCGSSRARYGTGSRTGSNPVRGRGSSAKQNDAEERHDDEHSQHIDHG